MSHVGSVIVNRAARIASICVMMTVSGALLVACQSDPDIDITKLGVETDPPETLYNQGLANIKAGNIVAQVRRHRRPASVLGMVAEGAGDEHLHQVSLGALHRSGFHR